MTEDICVTRFREYIRINTMQPNPDYKVKLPKNHDLIKILRPRMNFYESMPKKLGSTILPTNVFKVSHCIILM